MAFMMTVLTVVSCDKKAASETTTEQPLRNKLPLKTRKTKHINWPMPVRWIAKMVKLMINRENAPFVKWI